MIRLVDDVGREVTLATSPRRVVSLVPSLTETVCALGRGSVLAGVTRHCVEPRAELANVARVGGTKNPDLERIGALDPDLVIINAEENRKEDFEELERYGWPIFVSFPRTVAEVPDLIRRLGTLLDAAPVADAAAGKLEAVVADTRPAADASAVPVFCPIWKNPWMTFNADTFADSVLRSAGGRNIFAGAEVRYPEITLEDAARAQPEVVLLPDEPYVFGRKDLSALAPLQGCPALAGDRVHFIDGKALFWFGTRTAAALPYLRRMINASAARPRPSP